MKKLILLSAALAAAALLVPVHHADAALRDCPPGDPTALPGSVGFVAGCEQALNFSEKTVDQLCVGANAPSTYKVSEKTEWVNGCVTGYTTGGDNYQVNVAAWPNPSVNIDAICNHMLTLGMYPTLPPVQQDHVYNGCLRGYRYVINRLSGPNSSSFDDKAALNWCTATSNGQVNLRLGCAGGFAQAKEDYDLAKNPPADNDNSAGNPTDKKDTDDSDNTAGNPPDTDNTAGNPTDKDNTAGNPDCGDSGEIDSVCDVLKIIDRITNWMFTIFIAVAVIMVLFAAFVYLTSGGGEETAKAHKMLLYSAVAIAVAILAKGVVNVVKLIVKP